MRTLYNRFIEGTGKLRDVPLLMFRWILALGFYEPAMMKVKNLSGVAEWFESMNYPLPMVTATLSMVTEVTGIVLLIVGLGTRLISIPMMFVMVIATLTVHLPNGFPAGENGFEIPLYYFLMLFALVVYGSGKYSLDHLLNKRSLKS
ncbi:MAG: DoxX family protein [Bacteroidetes bacterium]|nr:MAG: DoxX family protein [Bacteroidota bacterium]